MSEQLASPPTPAFPLIARRRLVGLPFGSLAGARRGSGSDVAGSRPYQPGDNVANVDWRASARLSLAHDADEFVVREHHVEEGPKVVVICDRRPAMGLFGPEFPWLSKPEAMAAAGRAIAASARAAHGLVGSLDFAGGPEPAWIPPHGKADQVLVERRLAEDEFDAPADNLLLAFDHLIRSRRDLPPGSFLLVLSDFLDPPPLEEFVRLEGHRWEVVPVVIQDPLWEQSFPPIPSLVVPIADPATGVIRPVRVSSAEAGRRRRANEDRLANLTRRLEELGLEPVVIGSSAPRQVHSAFLAWAGRRLEAGGVPWS